MTQQDLKKIISYDRDTGEIKRLDRKNGNGSYDAYGYLIIKIKGKQYKAHRLAWMYEYGSFPSKNIDHINGDRSDNRIKNLRDVSQTVNCRERFYRVNTDTGESGIYYDTSTSGLKKRYTLKYRNKTLRFYSIEEAIIKRREIDEELGIKRKTKE